MEKRKATYLLFTWSFIKERKQKSSSWNVFNGTNLATGTVKAMLAVGEWGRIFTLSALTRKLKTIEQGIKPREKDISFALHLSLQLLARRKQLYF